jgi:hypothetical protein
MKKIFSHLLTAVSILILIGVPSLIYFKSSRFIIIALAGFLAIGFCDLLKNILFKKKFSPKLYILYVSIIIVDVGLLYIKHKSINLPESYSYFNPAKITHTSGIPLTRSAGKRYEMIWSYFKRRDQIQLNKLFDSSITPQTRDEQAAAANSLINFEFQFFEYPGIKLPSGLSWKENPFNDSGWNDRLHIMEYLLFPLNAFHDRKDTAYIKFCEKIILDWISDNSTYLFSPPSRASWGDFITARRLIYWLYFWELWSKTSFFTIEKMKIVLSSMIAHAERLADPHFYNYKHNHGIAQDYALILFTLVFPEMKKSGEWRNTAFRRLRNQIYHSVSSNGINLEHSSHYHFFAIDQLQNIYLLIDLFKEDRSDLHLRSTLLKMLQFIKYIIEPDGKIVPIGDTGIEGVKNYAVLLQRLQINDRDLSALFKSKDYTILRDTSVAFPKEGYAVIRNFRDSETSFERSLYLFFTAAAHKGLPHKHSDDLSFILSDNGYNLLIDPGYYSYRNDKYRDFVVGSSAHNTVTVDGKNFEGWNTKFEHFYSNSNYTAIIASHSNYKDILHRRWLIYLKYNKIFILDELTPKISNENKINHKFEQFFHSSDNITIKIKQPGKEVHFIDKYSGELLLRIIQITKDSSKINLYRGNENPVQGWFTKYHAKLEPSPVVGFVKTGKSAVFLTVLELKNLQNNQLDFYPDSIDIKNQHVLSINWNENSVRKNLFLDLSSQMVDYRENKAFRN